jgi:hypothetical protein
MAVFPGAARFGKVGDSAIIITAAYAEATDRFQAKITDRDAENAYYRDTWHFAGPVDFMLLRSVRSQNGSATIRPSNRQSTCSST